MHTYIQTNLLTLLTYLLAYLLTYLHSYLLSYLLTYILTYLLTYLLKNLLTPQSRVHLEKLTGFQLVKKFPTYYGTRRFITGFTSDRHLSLSWAISIQSTPAHPTSWRSILILSSHLLLGLRSGLFPSDFPTKTRYTPLRSPIRATCPAHLILLDFITRTILGEQYRSLSSSLCSFLHSPVTLSFLGPNILLKTIFEAQVQEYRRGYTISTFGVDVPNMKCRYIVIFLYPFSKT